MRFDRERGSLSDVDHVRAVAIARTPDPVRDRGTAARLVRSALERSVDRHLVSDVPVAVFLSGGIDSSVVAALAAQRAGTSIDGFTVTFGERGFDESAVARIVAKRYRIRHHEIPLGGTDLLAALPDAFSAMDQPTLDGINTYVVSRAVRAHGTKVVLSGLGGDEMFAGYPSFRRARALAPLCARTRPSAIPRGSRRVQGRRCPCREGGTAAFGLVPQPTRRISRHARCSANGRWATSVAFAPPPLTMHRES